MFLRILKTLFMGKESKGTFNNSPLSILENGKPSGNIKLCDTSSAEPDSPKSFGYKCAWLAIKNSTAENIAKKLQITNLEKSNWSHGIDTAYAMNGKVFITPPLDSWTLVISTSLPIPGDERHPNKIKEVIEFLSKEFNEVQYFCTYRVSEYHCWAKAIHGKIARGYCYCGEQGEIFWNEGKKTQDEFELNINSFDENFSGNDNIYIDAKDLRYPNEEDVMGISKRWSIDTSFESRSYPPSTGFIGVYNNIIE